MPDESSRLRFREIFSDTRLALMLGLGFGSGLPLLLVLGTQTLRLAEAKVPVQTIGLMAWVALPYSLKFFWAPVVDEKDVPWLSQRLGRRRAWLLLAQLAVTAGLVALAYANPARGLGAVIAAATFTAFAGATQDIVVDGWRIDAAPVERQGVMAAVYNFGYRLALLCSGAGALFLADGAGWRRAYLVMAALMLVGIVSGLLAPRLPERAPRLRAEGAAARGALRERLANYVAPVVELAGRYGWRLLAIVLLVALYRLPDFLTGTMAGKLYIDLGFTKSEIATMSKVYGVWIGVAGAFAGGWVITRIGLMPALLIGGASASASHLCLAWLAASGKSLILLGTAVSVENFAGNFAGAALVTFMSSLTAPAFAASQYALLSSLYALFGKFISGYSGYAVAAIGFPRFFVASSTIGIPVTLLCLLVWALRPADRRATARGRADDGQEPSVSVV